MGILCQEGSPPSSCPLPQGKRITQLLVRLPCRSTWETHRQLSNSLASRVIQFPALHAALAVTGADYQQMQTNGDVTMHEATRQSHACACSRVCVVLTHQENDSQYCIMAGHGLCRLEHQCYHHQSDKLQL